jgi:hypothetical protein
MSLKLSRSRWCCDFATQVVWAAFLIVGDLVGWLACKCGIILKAKTFPVLAQSQNAEPSPGRTKGDSFGIDQNVARQI